jgi:hypothetical protein
MRLRRLSFRIVVDDIGSVFRLLGAILRLVTYLAHGRAGDLVL